MTISRNTGVTGALTVGEVYGRDVEIPKGYKYVAFRPPRSPETYLNTGIPVVVLAANCFPNEYQCPRIIVEKLPLRRWVFEETGEVRKVKDGEYFLIGRHIVRCLGSFHESKILRLVEGMHLGRAVENEEVQIDVNGYAGFEEGD